MSKYKRLLNEDFETRRFKEGEAEFRKHVFEDKHIKDAIKLIAEKTGISENEIVQEIHEKMIGFQEMYQKAPLLYHTLIENIVEDQVFTKFWKSPEVKVEGAPKFNITWFNLLIERIKVENGEFNPMRGFMDSKRLHEIEFIIAPRDVKKYPQYCDPKSKSFVGTAAATPKGKFIFNSDFLQKLMDWAHLEQIKPKGQKYKSNGGDFPDEYCYVEFVILHEFMHYTNDDFHYQKVIKNANPQIINWVGDFRSNYLLVKSGYTQLPMGLFNDKINYDRQHSYIEMYLLVEEEFKKLSEKDQNQATKDMNERSDEHEPGQGEGEGMDEGNDGEFTEGDIDEKGKKQQENFKNSKDQSKEEAEKERKEREAENAENRKKAEASETGQRGSKGSDDPATIDYSNVKPKNWAALIKQFLDTSSAAVEENWTRPKWSHTMGAGGGSMPSSGKPTERPLDLKKVKLAFCVDSSGSMSDVVEKVYANIEAVLKSKPQLANMIFTLLRFSSDVHIYKGIFKTNKATELKDVNDTYSNLELNLKTVFCQHYGSVTNFDDTLSSQLIKLLNDKYNIIIFSDSDITSGANLEELKKVLKTKTGKVFIIFDTRTNYLAFRKNSNMATVFMSYIEEA
jgi:hypothetical protein